MHIMFVTGEYPPMPGGVGAYTQELAKALCHLGVPSTVITSQAAADPATAAAITNGSCRRILPIVQRWDWSIWRIVKNLAAEVHADWIHVQYQTAAFAMHPAINFAPERWRDGRQLVAWTYHDILAPYLFPKAGDKLRQWVTERPAHAADAVVVTNEGDKQRLATHAVASTSIPIGSNITGRILTADERARRRRAYGFGDEELVLSYFGFLNRSKGGITLIRALQRLAQLRNDVHLLMIGDQVGASDATNAAYLEEVKTVIRKAGLEQRVQWTGLESDADVAADLNSCDILLMPYSDGASLRRGTLMAGLANGCAIVTTTPQAPLPELVDGRDLLYVEPENEEALAGAVLRLAGEPEFAVQLRTNARLRSALFAWDSIARAHLDLYTHVRRSTDS